MSAHSIYAAFAVILPISLGLGLIHLAAVGRIDAYTAVAAALLLAIAMAAGIYLREAAERQALDGTDERCR